MGKTLILMRHAKSSWTDSNLKDHDRPLNKRGRSAAPEMAGRLYKKGLVPDYIFCSTATRAKETAELMLPSWQEKNITVAYEAELFHASAGTMLDLIQEMPDKYNSSLVIAHNPGMQQLINRLVPKKINHLPTAGLAVINFNVDNWKKIYFKQGELQLFDFPKKIEHREM